MKTLMIILSTNFSRLRQWRCKVQLEMQGQVVATDYYSILDFAGRAKETKGRLKNINGQINVSGLLVFYQLIFMVNLP